MDRLVETTQTFVAQYFNLDAESVYVSSLDAVIKQMETMMASFSLLMGSVASDLAVRGRHRHRQHVVATNVTERIREIGLRSRSARAAATKQFLLEAIMLCVAAARSRRVRLPGRMRLGQVIGARNAMHGRHAGARAGRGVRRRNTCACSSSVVFGYYPAAAPPSSTRWSRCATSRRPAGGKLEGCAPFASFVDPRGGRMHQA